MAVPMERRLWCYGGAACGLLIGNQFAGQSSLPETAWYLLWAIFGAMAGVKAHTRFGTQPPPDIKPDPPQAS
jgi:hypothetical protein